MYELLFRHLLFPAYERLAHRRGTAAYLREYERTQWLDPAALARHQLAGLNRLLAHAWAEVPYLRRTWAEHGLSPRPLEDVSELARYPLLTKAQITASYQDMIAASWRGRSMGKGTGGSTTGEPFRFEYTMESYARRSAVMWRGYAWAGLEMGRRSVYVWGQGVPKGGWHSAKERLYHAFFNRSNLNAYAIRDDNVDEYLAALERARPRIVVGYVAPLLVLARGLAARGRTLRGVEGVITGAEALHEPERKVLEAAFGCPVFNTYGCREFMLLGAECREKRGLHVSADHLVLEIVDGRGAPAGLEAGDVVVTDLHNFAMPFVRYVTGDRARLSGAACPCGRGLPLLGAVEGRELDIIRTPDGRSIPGEYFVHVMLEWPQIRQWRLVQTGPATLEFLLVAKAPLDEAQRAALLERTRYGLGGRMTVELRFVDALPPTTSDKRRLTVGWRPKPGEASAASG
jgi:phenylacetate-CoA ligase